jgi:hypothetical protein
LLTFRFPRFARVPTAQSPSFARVFGSWFCALWAPGVSNRPRAAVKRASGAGLVAACAFCAVLAMPLPVGAQEAAPGGPDTPSGATDVGQGADPADSISTRNSTQDSPQALSADQAFAARQKELDDRSTENNYEFAVEQHNCYDTFFVNHCVNKARDKMRAIQADIRSQQLSLDDEKRAEHARQRDQQQALKQAQNDADAPQRAAQDARNQQAFEDKQRQHALDQAQRQSEAPQRTANEQAYEQKQRQHAIDQAQRGISPTQAAANQKAYDQKQADFQRQLDEAHQQAAQKAQERTEKQQRYQQKQIDAAQHKKDVEARQKQAAEKAQQKQQDDLKQQQQLDQQQKQQKQQ